MSLLAGADTVRFAFVHRGKSLIITKTVSAILSVILAFVLYPEVQAKAQAELDTVVGPTRLPSFDDRPQLPYIDAILLEALRWNPVVPMGVSTDPWMSLQIIDLNLGVAHRSVKADIYRGYYIPAGMFRLRFPLSVCVYTFCRCDRRC